jgi:putative cell wall-binding protein
LILHEMFEETFPNGVEKWKLVVLDGWCYLEFYFMRIFMERSVSNLPNPLINT